MGAFGQIQFPAAIIPRMTQYPLYWRPVGPQGQSGQVKKTLLPPGFDPRTNLSIASRYKLTELSRPICYCCHVTHKKTNLINCMNKIKHSVNTTFRRLTPSTLTSKETPKRRSLKVLYSNQNIN
jgi:hypothetical protein